MKKVQPSSIQEKQAEAAIPVSGDRYNNGVGQGESNPTANSHAANSREKSNGAESSRAASSGDASSRHEGNSVYDGGAASSITRTPSVSGVIELEPNYRTRYGAWCGIFVLWLASLTAVLMRGDAPEWLLLGSFTCIAIFSGVFPMLAATGISFERQLSTATLEQGDLYVTVKLQRKLPVPGVWYATYDQLQNMSTMRKHRIKLRASFMPMFHRSMSLTYKVSAMERGCYETAPAVIRIGDWLGLTCIKVEVDQKAKLIVLPKLEQPMDESYVALNTSSKWMKQTLHRSEEQQRRFMAHRSQHQAEFSDYSMNTEDEGLGLSTRPYAAGDSFRRIDHRAAARGRGLNTRVGAVDDTSPSLCMILDQYDLPYQEAQQDQMFSSLISWCLADTVEAGQQQNISVLCDNWSFEFTGEKDVKELQYLLAITRPDVSVHMKDRVPYMSMLLPTGGYIVVYSGAWKDSEGWIALAETAWMKGSRLELQFVTTNRVMTYAMREQQKVLEQAGIQVVWRYSYEKPEPAIEVEEGSERYVSGA